MVRLTRIYTKTGDDGTTGLGNNQRVKKHDPHVDAIGDVDEANSAIGVAMSFINNIDILEVLLIVQNDMFDIGAELSTHNSPITIKDEHVKYLEDQIDRFNEKLESLNSFVLPSGSKPSSHLHLARAVVRRAERRVWVLFNYFEINKLLPMYLNRLSDLLFVLARCENKYGDILWKPGGNK